MINLIKMKQQHGRIKEEINYLENEVNKGSLSLNTMELALHINRLAGLLKIHLLEEDQFLYPDLLVCSNKEIQDMAKLYIQEMGSLVSVYTNFKSQYNTSSKIVKNNETFLYDCRKIIGELKNRIMKEDLELYHLIQQKNL